jgi:hypothetical protein
MQLKSSHELLMLILTPALTPLVAVGGAVAAVQYLICL